MSKHRTWLESKRGLSQKQVIRKFMMMSALYLSAAPLEAARPVALRGITFNQIDLTRNGYIERNEAASRPEFGALLLAADLDRDGRLSEEEFKAAQGAMKPGKI